VLDHTGLGWRWSHAWNKGDGGQSLYCVWIVVRLAELDCCVYPSLMHVRASKPGNDAQESLVPDRMAVEDVMVAATSMIVVGLSP
jgi:hypothetical protein